jgi:hypothetical protein
MSKLIAAIILTLFPALAWSQGYATRAPDVEPGKIELQPLSIALGCGSFFDRANVTFSSKAMYGALQWHGVGFPALADGTSTGLAIEGHPATLFSEDFEAGEIRVQALEAVDYRVWSTTRIPISAIPIARLQSGVVANMFSGVDALLAEGGPDDFTGDFDARLVVGGDFGGLGPGRVVLEIYMFQRNVPVSFALFYGF